jgi:hypothetical protein
MSEQEPGRHRKPQPNLVLAESIWLLPSHHDGDGPEPTSLQLDQRFELLQAPFFDLVDVLTDEKHAGFHFDKKVYYGLPLESGYRAVVLEPEWYLPQPSAPPTALRVVDNLVETVHGLTKADKASTHYKISSSEYLLNLHELTLTSKHYDSYEFTGAPPIKSDTPPLIWWAVTTKHKEVFRGNQCKPIPSFTAAQQATITSIAECSQQLAVLTELLRNLSPGMQDDA